MGPAQDEEGEKGRQKADKVRARGKPYMTLRNNLYL